MFRVLSCAAGALVWGCTFYTDCPETGCPDDDGGGNISGTGGTGAGGSGSGGSAGVIGGAAPTGPWVNATGNLAGEETGFGDVSYVSAKPDEDKLIVGLSERGLWASVDGAETWERLGSGTDSAVIANRASSIHYDPEDAEVFWESGSYGAAVFVTRDNGDTFEQLGTISHADAVSIDFTDEERMTLLTSAHEQGRALHWSTDGGSTWEDIGADLPDGANSCNYALVLDAQTFLITCSQFDSDQHGVFRTTDTGQSWSQVADRSAWNAPLLASDGSVYWSIENNAGLLKGTALGEEWTELLSGGVLTLPPIELPDGSIAATTPDYVILSSDGGETWRPVTSELPFRPDGLAYSDFQKAFYIWHGTTVSAVPEDAIQRYDFDYATEP